MVFSSASPGWTVCFSGSVGLFWKMESRPVEWHQPRLRTRQLFSFLTSRAFRIERPHVWMFFFYFLIEGTPSEVSNRYPGLPFWSPSTLFVLCFLRRVSIIITGLRHAHLRSNQPYYLLFYLFPDSSFCYWLKKDCWIPSKNSPRTHVVTCVLVLLNCS